MGALLFRSATCPSLETQPSPTKRSPSPGSHLSRSSSAGGLSMETSSTWSLAGGVGRKVWVATALYALLFVTVPIAYLEWRGPLPRPTALAPAELAAASSGGPLLKLEPGAALARSRKLQRPGGPAQATLRAPGGTNPGGREGLAGLDEGPAKESAGVEFGHPGLRLPLQDALDSTLWISDQLYRASPPEPASPASARAAPYPRPRPSLAARLRALPAPPPACPRTQIRLLIGIMSRCCTASAIAKRRSIRETWLQLAAARPELSVRFFVSQAESSEAAAEAARALEEEATQFGDLVVLPGAESYFELPLKTLELLGYALRSPCNFTHVLKTDDDVYVRPDRLLRVLEEGEFEFSVPIRAPADARTRFDGLYSGRYLDRRAAQLDEEARRGEETRKRLKKFPRVPGARPLATMGRVPPPGSAGTRPSVTAAALQSEIAQRGDAARRLEAAQQAGAAPLVPEGGLPSADREVPDPVEGAAQHTLAQALSGARLALSRRATRADVPRPWMQGVFVGQLDTNKSDIWPGWVPDRDAHHKWYLSEERLSTPDARSLMGTRWISGWGYLLSRDVAQAVRQQAETAAWNLGEAGGGGADGSDGAPGAAWRPAVSPALSPAQRSLPGQPRPARPEWWGRLPWEDVLVAALAEAAPGRIGELFHHGGFKPAWNGCDSGTVLKHLDNDAPRLMQGLHAQQVSGLWDAKEVVCSTGPFQTGSEEDWRAWRNTLPDVLRTGLM